MALFYHNNYYIGFSQQKACWFLVSLFFMVFSFVLFFETKKIIYYYYVFKEAKLAKFIRFEAGWKLYISITKFWRCGEMMAILMALRNIGKSWSCELWSREVVKLKYFAFWRVSSLCCATFRMTRLCFLLTIRNLNYFWNAKIFYNSCVFKKAKWEFASELLKRVF